MFESNLYLILLIISLLCLLVTIIIYQKRHNQDKRKIIAIEHSFEQKMLKQELDVQEKTFNTVAHEIHDNFGQLLTLSIFNLSNLADKLPADHRDDAEKIVTVLRSIGTEMRSFISVLNPRLSESGFQRALEMEIERLKNTGQFEIVYKSDGNYQYLGKQTDLYLFRICQELINNIIKHSKATSIRIIVKYSHEQLFLSISDDGTGFDVAKAQSQLNEGFGLQSLFSRAKSIGAKIDIVSAFGRGTSVSITLPINISKNERQKQ
jgi:two-component system, NarL family, sensor kinase